jgi:hypothetical protein
MGGWAAAVVVLAVFVFAVMGVKKYLSSEENKK